MGKTERTIKLKKLDTMLRDLDHERADAYRRATAGIRECREAVKALAEMEKEGDKPTS